MARSLIPFAMKFKQLGLAKSETGLVKRNGALLDRCNVNFFPRARRLHFKSRKKSGKQEVRGFIVQSLNSTFFPPHIGAEPGSAPIWGGKKGEFRDWT